MSRRIVISLIRKDLTLYFRNRFFAFVSVLGVVAYAGIYLIMPNTVDETLDIGLYAPAVPPLFAELMEEGGLDIHTMDSEDALKESIIGGEYVAGLVLPADLIEKLTSGQKGQIRIYFTADAPTELRDAFSILFEELAFAMGGQPLNIEVSEEILGPDLAGMQIPLRDRMLPLFAVLILMVETMGLASLITEEVEGRTIQALMVTPMRVEGLFVGKGITGVGLAFTQAALLMAATGGLSWQPFLILITLLLGALLVTAIGFLVASVAKDMMSVMSWSILAILVLGVPTFSVMFPGTVAEWVKLIPSYYLVDTVHQVANFNLGWSEVGSNLLILLAFSVALLWLGTWVLRRRLT